MKIQVGCAVAVLMIAIGAKATDEAPLFKTSLAGHARFRSERSDRTDYSSQRSALLLRIRPELKLSRGESLSFFFQPQFAKAFGKPEFPGSSATGNTSQQTSGGTYDTPVVVHQANIEYRASDSLEFVLGRQFLSYGDELVLSSLDWDNVGRSFDAIRAKYSHGAGSVDLFYSKLFASFVGATAQGLGDSDLVGLYSSNNFGEGLRAADLYVIYRRSSTTGTDLDLFALGARVKDRIGDFDYRAEFTKQFGSQFANVAQAYQIDLEAGWNFESPVKSRIGVEVFQAGDNYDQLYPLAHKYLGIADIFGRRNIQGGVLHLSAVPMEGLTAQFDWHYLMKTTSATPYKLNGGTAIGTGANSSNNLGSEFDFMLTYTASDQISATLGGGMLLAGDHLTAVMGSFNPAFCYFQIVTKL